MRSVTKYRRSRLPNPYCVWASRVGHGPETDLFQDTQVNVRVIVVEPCERARVTGNHVAQGGNADQAIGEDGDEHGAQQAGGPPTMGDFADHPSPGIPAIEDEACHGVVEDQEGHDDEVGEGQLALVQQPPLDGRRPAESRSRSSAQARHIPRRCR